ncbi:3-oxoacyl-[acyl-carrier-protein] reductase [Ascochyta rabiei]|uniref:3-oxoacyl-[acyl-carrier-protein] reductase n=1 Tax=Didymella rabiei TaxID=5454 RepID=UPI002206DCC3|nr:3-oxoacyl-[acyl-carrier-protein] reductase [Ascochyta rabiei]UPX10734.1 3-oxoacyl-[acyl-carrier-protein] reductase [Ascochyta rabiei]
MASRIRHVLITGGSRGIGLAIAQALARQSYRCTLISRSEKHLKAALTTLSPITATPHGYVAGSIASPDFWTTTNFSSNGLVKGDDASKIDVLVNCAGITQSRLFTTTPTEDIESIVETNLTALMLGTRFLLRNKYLHSTTRSRSSVGQTGLTPSIINVSSLLGVNGGYGAVAYAASKAGVLGFTRALAAEYMGHGVRVNAIVPGYVESDMTKVEGQDTTQKIRSARGNCTCSGVSHRKPVCA